MRCVADRGDWGRVEVYVFVYVVEEAYRRQRLDVVVTMWSPQVGLLEAAGRV
jgi:hypothetical protein